MECTWNTVCDVTESCMVRSFPGFQFTTHCIRVFIIHCYIQFLNQNKKNQPHNKEFKHHFTMWFWNLLITFNILKQQKDDCTLLKMLAKSQGEIFCCENRGCLRSVLGIWTVRWLFIMCSSIIKTLNLSDLFNLSVYFTYF